MSTMVTKVLAIQWTAKGKTFVLLLGDRQLDANAITANNKTPAIGIAQVSGVLQCQSKA